jgi:glucose/arabinose dehydrogenase
LVFGLAVGCTRNIPEGFNQYVVYDRLNRPTDIVFAPDGKVLVAEKRGVVKEFDNLLDDSPTVLVDIRTNVIDQADRGLLDIELAPGFPADPSLYVLYTHDAPPGEVAPFWGQPAVDVDPCPTPPGPTDDGCVVTARLSRLPIVNGVWTGEEQVLIQDWCQQYPSHSIGTMVFGPDGSLYVGGGDGASWTFRDYGQRGDPLNPCGDPPGGVGASLHPPTAEGGSLRSQDVRTTGDPTGLNGTIIRIDPATGDAMPDNPMASSPDPNTRRIVAYGMRNPFRFTLRPGTNELWIGDVGESAWEEINRSVGNDAVVDNFGWPCYQGTPRMPTWDNLDLTMCESLYAAGPSAVTAPWFAYQHGPPIGTDSRCDGKDGSSITGVTFAPADSSYPDDYDGALFFGDASRSCIWVMKAGSDGLPDPTTVKPFVVAGGTPVKLAFGPGGELWYVDHYGGRIVRIGYASTNHPPQAAVTATPTSGEPPLAVSLDARGSTDPDPGDELTYAWDLDDDGMFDDGSTPQLSHTFTEEGFVIVRVRVSDLAGDTDIGLAGVTVGDPTAPTAVIETPEGGTTAAVGDTISFSGFGVDPDGNLLPPEAMTWSADLLHCPDSCHRHGDWFTAPGVLNGSWPLPDHGFSAALEVKLTVVWQGHTASSTRRIDYRSTDLTVTSDPIGVEVSAGDTTAATPITMPFSTNGQVTLTAPATATIDGIDYIFSSWSDGGARSHEITVPADPALYTASYVPVGLSFADAFDDGDSTGWTVASGNWAICPAPNGAPGFAFCGQVPVGDIGVALADGVTLTDGVVEATTVPAENGGKAGVIARVQDAEHYYGLRLDDKTGDELGWRLQRRDGGTVTTILASGSIPDVPDITYRLRLTMSGDQLIAELSTDDGQTYTELGRATDTAYTTGGIGLETRLRTNPFDSVFASGS